MAEGAAGARAARLTYGELLRLTEGHGTSEVYVPVTGSDPYPAAKGACGSCIARALVAEEHHVTPVQITLYIEALRRLYFAHRCAEEQSCEACDYADAVLFGAPASAAFDDAAPHSAARSAQGANGPTRGDGGAG